MDSVAEVAKVLVSTGAPLSRGEIVVQCGRSHAAVSGAVDALVAAGLVEVDRAALPSSGGRPADRVGLAASGVDVVGLHVAPSTYTEFEVRALRADLRGRVVADSERRWAVESFEAALGLLPRVVEEMTTKPAPRTLVGIALPGVVTEDAEGRGAVAMFSRHVRSRPANVVADLGLQGWRASALNAQDAAAVGVLLTPGCDAQSVLYVYWGFGLGSGLAVRSGRGYPRTSGGEIGHMPVALDPETARGRPCYCGAQGCLTAHVQVLDGVRSAGHDVADLEAALIRAETDPTAGVVVEQMAALVGAGVAGVVNLTAPDRVVIGGPVTGAAPRLTPIIAATVTARVLDPHRGVVVEADDHVQDRAIRGVIDHVRHRFLSGLDKPRIARLRAAHTP